MTPLFKAPAMGQLVSVQYLRAIAAMMVLLSHLDIQMQRVGYAGSWLEWPTRGVDIFFVISGFVMWMAVQGRRTHPLTFYWRRIVRIVPLYWVLTGITVALLLMAPQIVRSGRFDAHHALMSFLFLPSPHPLSGEMFPVLEPGWTLNYEMYFYAVFGLMLLLPERFILQALLIWLIAMALLGSTALFDNQFLAFYGSSITVEFGLGAALGAAFTKGWVLPRRVAIAAIVLGFLALSTAVMFDRPRVLVAGLPALAIVAGFVSLETLCRNYRIPLLLLIGDASYALYLSHGLVLSACGQLGTRLMSVWPSALLPMFAAASTVLALMVAIMIHHLFERPVIVFARRRRTLAVLVSHPSGPVNAAG